MTKLEQIKAECRKAIELGEAATDGPWMFVEDGGICGKGYAACIWTSRGPGRGAVATTAPWSHATEQNLQNSSFIAHARTFSPAAAKALLVAIEALEEAADDCHLQASNAIEQICQQWPDPVQDQP